MAGPPRWPAAPAKRHRSRPARRGRGRRIGDGLPAQRRRADLVDAAGRRRHRAQRLAKRGDGDLAARRDGDAGRQLPAAAIGIGRHAIDDGDAALPDDAQVHRRARRHAARQAVDLDVAGQRRIGGGGGRERVVHIDRRRVGLVDGQGEQGQQLAVLAVRLQIGVRAVDAAVLLLEILQHLAVTRRAYARGVDDRGRGWNRHNAACTVAVP